MNFRGLGEKLQAQYYSASVSIRMPQVILMNRSFTALLILTLVWMPHAKADIVVLSGSGGGGESRLADVDAFEFSDPNPLTQVRNPFNLFFTATSSLSLVKINIAMKVGGAGSGTSNYTATFIDSAGGSTGSKTGTINLTHTGGGYQGFDFDLTGGNLSVGTTGVSQLRLTITSGTQSIKWENWNSTSITGPWADGSSSNPKSDFVLTAVPEPTTMFLTGSVLAIGLVASRINRLRKRKETVDAAV